MPVMIILFFKQKTAYERRISDWSSDVCSSDLKSWGYGDACPVTAGNVILDLSRMNRIREVDPALAYAVIEPGVTQGQLSEHLRAQGIALWPDCTGAGPDTSIVGNILDRGFGPPPSGNRAQYNSGLEIVLDIGRAHV